MGGNIFYLLVNIADGLDGFGMEVESAVVDNMIKKYADLYEDSQEEKRKAFESIEERIDYIKELRELVKNDMPLQKKVLYWDYLYQTVNFVLDKLNGFYITNPVFGAIQYDRANSFQQPHHGGFPKMPL